MGLKAYKPTTSGRRGMTIVTTEELTKKKPEKTLKEKRAQKSEKKASKS